MTQLNLIFDFETRSEADLKKVGAWIYSKDPSTKILCVAWKLGTKESLKNAETKVWSPVLKGDAKEFLSSLANPAIKIVAHNALFEQVIVKNVLSKMFPNLGLENIPHERWICTAARAAALALPRNLEGACQVLGLPVQKDMEGRRLILKYCKPRKPTKNNPAKWHQNKNDLLRIVQYCKTDVDAETELFLATPGLNKIERDVWALDQKINFRGVACDIELINNVLSMVEIETNVLNKEAVELTGGAIRSANQRDTVLKFIQNDGGSLPDLKAKTVNDALDAKLLNPKGHRLLEIRQDISKTSTAKFEAFRRRADTDGRVRDLLLYHGASTGRWSGTGIQPQNFPRGNIKDTDLAAHVVNDGNLELVRLVYGRPMDVFASCLRSVIVAPEGKELFCADYAAVEARVLFWVADHTEGLKAFREGRDLYKEMAAFIFKKPIDQIEKSERQLGKSAILGSGYQMGAKKFHETCALQGLDITKEMAEVAVKGYRTLHCPVVNLWRDLELAAIRAVKRPGQIFEAGKTKWWVFNDFLWCELPSKRRLAYYKPERQFKLMPWGDKKETLYHWSINSMTKKWELGGTYGGRLVENIVQAIARDFLAEAMLRIEKAGYEIVLSVHDELLAERKIGKGSLAEFEKLMAQNPEWAYGLPTKVEGWQGKRYRK